MQIRILFEQRRNKSIIHLVFTENILPGQTNGLMPRVRMIFWRSMFSTLTVLSQMTCVDTVACVSYMLQVEPLHMSWVGYMPLFKFQDFRIPRGTSITSSLPPGRTYLSRWHCFATRQSSVRYLMLRGEVLSYIIISCEKVTHAIHSHAPQGGSLLNLYYPPPMRRIWGSMFLRLWCGPYC